jgi:hypothetical protein
VIPNGAAVGANVSEVAAGVKGEAAAVAGAKNVVELVQSERDHEI